VSFQIIGDHAKVGSNDRMKMTPEEMKASAESLLSYFGTYTVNRLRTATPYGSKAVLFRTRPEIQANAWSS